MGKPTFADLPGLQKAARKSARIEGLQYRINLHYKFAAWLVDMFNDQHQAGNADVAEKLQVLCEFHAIHASGLEGELQIVKDGI